MSELWPVLLGGAIAVSGGLVASLANGAIQRRHDARSDLRNTVDEGLVSAANCMEGITAMWSIGAGRRFVADPSASTNYDAAHLQMVGGKRGLNITLSKMNARLGPDHELPLAVSEFKKKVGTIQSMLPNALYLWKIVSSPTREDRREVKDLIASAETELVRLEAISADTLDYPASRSAWLKWLS